MEKHQVILFPTSSTSSASASAYSKVDYNPSAHVEKADVLSTQRKAKSAQKESDKDIKQHRYAFHTRSLVDVPDDGYDWRKYGNKKVKNSKFPRSYYRCCHRGCNVKKQIQRLSEDEQIVVTTYEGIHRHPAEKSAESFDQILGNLFISKLPSNVHPKLECVRRDY